MEVWKSKFKGNILSDISTFVSVAIYRWVFLLTFIRTTEIRHSFAFYFFLRHFVFGHPPIWILFFPSMNLFSLEMIRNVWIDDVTSFLVRGALFSPDLQKRIGIFRGNISFTCLIRIPTFYNEIACLISTMTRFKFRIWNPSSSLIGFNALCGKLSCSF